MPAEHLILPLQKFYRCAKLRPNDRLYGEFDILGFPWRFSDFAEPLGLEAALLGRHNAEVLRGFGHNDEEIEMLCKEGILNEKEG